MKDPKEDNISKLYALLFVVLIVWIITPFIIGLLYPELNDRALLGDSFGTINSLFSGLAFAGIIYTILLQKKELALQRQELKETRAELKRSATAQENSERQLERQSVNLRITAELNALNTLVNYNTSIMEGIRNSAIPQYQKARNDREEYIMRIKEKIANKEIRDD